MGDTLRTEREMFQALAIAISAFLAIAQAQDTTYCPDGWDVIQGHTADSINCILLGGLEERVTKKDAELICGGHDGWLVEIQAEHNGHHGNHKNRDIVKLISAKQGQNNIGTPGYNFQDQWWIGATCQGPHGDHNQGHWTWDHCGSDVQWFDFYDNEPNNWHSQNCLTFLKDQDIFGFGVYHWNDWGCDYVARYICEKAPMMPSTTAAPEPETTAPEHQQFPRVAKYLRRGLWN